jgi:hypothetical protein
MTVFRDVVPCSLVEVAMIALMMEATTTSETSLNFNQTTRRNIPEDSHLQMAQSRRHGVRTHNNIVILIAVRN